MIAALHDTTSSRTNAARASEMPGTVDELKETMRRTASAVAVVTAKGETESRGATISTATLVSLEPAVVSLSLQRHSQMEVVMATAERFYLHFLSSDQAPLARRFAERGRAGRDQFEGLPIVHAEAPRLPEALVTLTCVPHGSVQVGDHTIVLGQVIEVDRAMNGSPLLYHDRSYRQIGEPVAERDASES